MNIPRELYDLDTFLMEKNAASANAFSGTLRSIAKNFGRPAARATSGAAKGAVSGALGGAALGGAAGFFDPGTNNNQGTPGIMDRVRGGFNGALTGGAIGAVGGAALGGYKGYNAKPKTPAAPAAPKTVTEATGINGGALTQGNVDNSLIQDPRRSVMVKTESLNTKGATTVAVKMAERKVCDFIKEAAGAASVANPKAKSGLLESLSKALNHGSTGAMYGGLGGAALGFIDPETDKNPLTGQKSDPTIMQRLKGGVQGAMTGAVLGGAGGVARGAYKNMNPAEIEVKGTANQQAANQQAANQQAANQQAANQQAANQQAANQQAANQQAANQQAANQRAANQQAANQQAANQQAANQQAANQQAANQQTSPYTGYSEIMENLRTRVTPDTVGDYADLENVLQKYIQNPDAKMSLRDRAYIRSKMNKINGFHDDATISSNAWENKLVSHASTPFSESFDPFNESFDRQMPGAVFNMNHPYLSIATKLPIINKFTQGGKIRRTLDSDVSNEDKESILNYLLKRGSYNPFRKFASAGLDDILAIIDESEPVSISHQAKPEFDPIKQIEDQKAKDSVIEMVADKLGSYHPVAAKFASLNKASASIWDNL